MSIPWQADKRPCTKTAASSAEQNPRYFEVYSRYRIFKMRPSVPPYKDNMSVKFLVASYKPMIHAIRIYLRGMTE